jgi:steroid delta-isomerase-like uncharacterized protein
MESDNRPPRPAFANIARRWISLWQGADLAGFDDLHAPDFIDHSPSGRTPGRAGFLAGIVELYRAFPDFHGTIEDLVVDSDSGKVAVRWTAVGTHEGTFLGIPGTGTQVDFAGIEIIRVADGKVVERWGEWDDLGLIEQLRAGSTQTIEAPRHVLTILAVSDLARSRRFYQEVFGWPIRVDVPVYVEFGLPDGNGVGLYAREGFACNTGLAPTTVPAGAISGTELYLRCPDPSVLSGRLEAAGARVLSTLAPRDWGDEAAYFADPDGNVIVVARPI